MFIELHERESLTTGKIVTVTDNKRDSKFVKKVDRSGRRRRNEAEEESSEILGRDEDEVIVNQMQPPMMPSLPAQDKKKTAKKYLGLIPISLSIYISHKSRL